MLCKHVRMMRHVMTLIRFMRLELGSLHVDYFITSLMCAYCCVITS